LLLEDQALRQVEDMHEACGSALEHQVARRDLDVDQRSVLLAMAPHPVVVARPRDVQCVEILLGADVGERHRGELFFGVPVDPHRRTIDGEERSVVVEHPHRQRRDFDRSRWRCSSASSDSMLMRVTIRAQLGSGRRIIHARELIVGNAREGAPARDQAGVAAARMTKSAPSGCQLPTLARCYAMRARPAIEPRSRVPCGCAVAGPQPDLEPHVARTSGERSSLTAISFAACRSARRPPNVFEGEQHACRHQQGAKERRIHRRRAERDD
jgi:hypothetical protein